MKVKELIQKLQEVNWELLVLWNGYEDWYDSKDSPFSIEDVFKQEWHSRYSWEYQSYEEWEELIEAIILN